MANVLNFHLPIGKSVDSVHTEKLKSAHASVLSRDVRSPQVMGGGSESGYFKEGRIGERGRGVPSCFHTDLLELFDSLIGPSP